MIKASGRAALIFAAGLFVCVAGPAQAASSSNNTTASSKPDAAGAPLALTKYTKHRRHSARRNEEKATKSSANKDASSDAVNSGSMPPQVANAKAQLAAADAPAGEVKPAPAQTSDTPQAAPNNPPATGPGPDGQVVGADQLNDLDRTLHQDAAPATPAAAASQDAVTPRPAPVMAAGGNDNSAWDRTSLIGKIFIGFGAVLTLASAARMFVA